MLRSADQILIMISHFNQNNHNTGGGKHKCIPLNHKKVLKLIIDKLLCQDGMD